MEKETVRTRVMLASGDQMPAGGQLAGRGSIDGGRTAPESMDALGAVCVADAVGEGVELVAGEVSGAGAGEDRGRTLADAS